VYKKYKTGELKLVEEKNVKKKEKTYYKEYLQLTQKRQYLCKFIIKQSWLKFVRRHIWWTLLSRTSNAHTRERARRTNKRTHAHTHTLQRENRIVTFPHPLNNKLSHYKVYHNCWKRRIKSFIISLFCIVYTCMHI